MYVYSRFLMFRYTLLACIIGLLASCGGGGGGGGGNDNSGGTLPSTATIATSEGPGDTDNLFPLSIGDTWNYSVIDTDTDLTPQTNNYINVARVSGTQLVSGITTSVINEDNADGQGQSLDSYYEKLLGGVNSRGSSDTTDTLTQLFSPYAELMFPLVPGSHFTRFNNLRKTYPEDLDGDGRNETITVNESVQTTAIEVIQVSAGNFADTRKVVDDIDLTITLSSNGSRFLTSGTATTWYAPSVGLVKQSSQLTINYAGGTNVTTSSVDLKGYNVDGIKKGIQPEFPLAITGLSQPGLPCVAYGGGQYLVVFYARQGFDTKLFGMFVSDAGVTSDAFVIVDAPGLAMRFDSRPGVIFDGTNFLIAYGYMSRIYGTRVATNGTLLDSGAGFAISSIVALKEDINPTIAFDGTNTLVVWSRKSLSSGVGQSILGSTVSPGGIAGSTITISPDIGTYRDYPSISYGAGNYLVAWVDGRNSAMSDGHIYAARVTPQNTVLDPNGFPVTETASAKDSVRAVFNGSSYQISWRTPGTTNDLYLTKYIAQNGQLIGQTAASAGDVVDVRNVARQGVMWVGGEGQLFGWNPTYDAIGSTASAGDATLVAWEQFGVMRAAFVYPRH